MEMILRVKNGKYYLEKISSDRKEKRRTNNQEKIANIISSLNEKVIRATFYRKDVKLFFGDGEYLTLKDYDKNQNLELYSSILNHIDENTRIVKNVGNINKNKLKYIAVTGVVIISVSLAGFLAKNKDNKAKTNITVEQNIKLTTIPTPTPIVVPTKNPTPIVAPTPAIFDIDYRMEQTLKLFNEQSDNQDVIPLATKMGDYFLNKINDFFTTQDWQYYNKCSLDFGVDTYLLLALSYAESNLEHEKTLPTGTSYNGHAVGLFQHEHPENERNITAYNYNTGEYETVRMCMDNACDKQMNVKMAAMMLQNRLHKYNNNIYITIQSYNYGEGAMDIILNEYAKEKNTTIEDIVNNYNDTGWLKYVKDFHDNPQKYLSNWEYETYGNANYVKDVLGYYIGTSSENRMSDGSNLIFDLVNLECIYEMKSR